MDSGRQPILLATGEAHSQPVHSPGPPTEPPPCLPRPLPARWRARPH